MSSNNWSRSYESQSDVSNVIEAVASMAAGAGAALYAVPKVASAVGFKPTGIESGSLAASMMRGHGGYTKSGSIVATGQSIGATQDVFSNPGVAVAIGAAGAALGYLAYQSIAPNSKKQ